MAGWQMPFQNPNAVQHDWLTTDAGQQAMWQNFQNYFLQGNGSQQARSTFQREFYPQMAAFETWSFQNPTTPKRFDEWISENQGRINAGYQNQGRAARGGRPGFGGSVRDLW